MSINQFLTSGIIDPRKIALAVNASEVDVAFTAGLEPYQISESQLSSPETQKGLREFLEIMNRVSRRFKSLMIAFAWVRSEPLDIFDGMTAMGLIHQGHASTVLAYIDDVENRAAA